MPDYDDGQPVSALEMNTEPSNRELQKYWNFPSHYGHRMWSEEPRKFKHHMTQTLKFDVDQISPGVFELIFNVCMFCVRRLAVCECHERGYN